MHHPADFFLKYLILKQPPESDADILKKLLSWGFLAPVEEGHIATLRASMPPLPVMFQPTNRIHRPSQTYLREQKLLEIFFPSEAMNEAWEILTDTNKRTVIDQLLMTKLDHKPAVRKINESQGWKLTVDGVDLYGHYFWNVKLLSFDDWGHFLHGRSAMHERQMALLQADVQLSYYHLNIDQVIESKDMVQIGQRIAFFTLLEVKQQTGAKPDKVKSVAILNKTIQDAHSVMTTSSESLREVLKQFEKFRMEHDMPLPRSMEELTAKKGSYSGNLLTAKKVEPEKV